MDIEANLKRQREIVAIIYNADALEMASDSDQADMFAELAELVSAMHDWLDKDKTCGALPAAWDVDRIGM